MRTPWYQESNFISTPLSIFLIDLSSLWKNLCAFKKKDRILGNEIDSLPYRLLKNSNTKYNYGLLSEAKLNNRK